MISMKTAAVAGVLSLMALSLVLLQNGCGQTHPQEPFALTANLTEERGRLILVLKNISGKEQMLCRRNFYLPLDYIDIKRYPDTTELTFERIFGKKPCVVKRKNVTMSDFVSLPPNQEARLPVDLRCVNRSSSLGDTVLVSVKFMNVDPFICSRIEVKKYKPEVQEYCELFHYVPDKALHYWSGEVKTPYFVYTFPK
jgi:hypothetical protein